MNMPTKLRGTRRLPYSLRLLKIWDWLTNSLKLPYGRQTSFFGVCFNSCGSSLSESMALSSPSESGGAGGCFFLDGVALPSIEAFLESAAVLYLFWDIYVHLINPLALVLELIPKFCSAPPPKLSP